MRIRRVVRTPGFATCWPSPRLFVELKTIINHEIHETYKKIALNPEVCVSFLYCLVPKKGQKYVENDYTRISSAELD